MMLLHFSNGLAVLLALAGGGVGLLMRLLEGAMSVLFVCENHGFGDRVVARRVLEYLTERALFVQGYAYFAGCKHKLPDGVVIGFFFWAVLEHDSGPISGLTTTIKLFVLRGSSPRLPWARPLATASSMLAEAQQCARVAEADEADEAAEKTGRTGDPGEAGRDPPPPAPPIGKQRGHAIAFKAMSVMHDYIGADYHVGVQHVRPRGEHQRRTLAFALRFAEEHLDLLKEPEWGPSGRADADGSRQPSYSGALLLFGEPGCGKTTIAMALAYTMGATLATVRPDVPGACLGRIFKEAEEGCPTVLLVDEADELLSKLATAPGLDPIYQSYKRSIYDRTTWNGFLDAASHTQRLVVVVAMNGVPYHAGLQKGDSFLRIHPSMLRVGRMLRYSHIFVDGDEGKHGYTDIKPHDGSAYQW